MSGLARLSSRTASNSLRSLIRSTFCRIWGRVTGSGAGRQERRKRRLPQRVFIGAPVISSIYRRYNYEPRLLFFSAKMSLNILSVLPDINSTGVILQGAVIVTFDEVSFFLSAPPETPRVPPGGLVGPVAPVTGTDYVQGTFTFAVNTAGATIATFTPARPMRPNVKYTVLITTVVQTP